MSEDDQNKKILIMKIGVAIFTIIILFIWIFNLKNVWQNKRQISSVSNQTSWLKLKTNLNKTLGDIQRQLNQINQAGVSQKFSSSTNFLVNLIKNSKQIVSPARSTTTSPAIVTTTVAIPTTIVSQATSSAVNNQNCPKYINCMPTVNNPAPPCQIPPACKNITTLVY